MLGKNIKKPQLQLEKAKILQKKNAASTVSKPKWKNLRKTQMCEIREGITASSLNFFEANHRFHF